MSSGGAACPSRPSPGLCVCPNTLLHHHRYGRRVLDHFRPHIPSFLGINHLVISSVHGQSLQRCSSEIAASSIRWPSREPSATNCLICSADTIFRSDRHDLVRYRCQAQGNLSSLRCARALRPLDTLLADLTAAHGCLASITGPEFPHTTAAAIERRC